MKQYFLNLSVLISQSINVIFLAGHPDQTVSARAYANQDQPAWLFVQDMINAVFFWQDNHCRTSYLEDITRARALLGE
ncbi:MAG: hypothetical protein RLZZ602_1595 [Pseudomonadota bacterium]|jgi:hypothetical protein